jgi:Response regulator containing a CheY-like receiver domain and an HTH DNA-binding domain
MPEYNLPVDILIADDHRIMVDGLYGILKDEKSIGQIYTSYNGRDAVNQALSREVDCVILDINMPELNGIEAAKMIRQQKPHVKIIMVSMLCDSSIVGKALKAGADAFIIKNTGKEELLKAISRVMKNEKYISADLSYDLLHKMGRPASDSSLHLTQREKEIIRYIAEGLTAHEIADRLFISHRTVDTHRKNILQKLNLKNIAALTRYAADHDLL